MRSLLPLLLVLAMVALVSAQVSSTEEPKKAEAAFDHGGKKCHEYDPKKCRKCTKDNMKDCVKSRHSRVPSHPPQRHAVETQK
ncbi:hypothetical protein SprV_0100384800 [Sparganum proliferum]